MRGRLGVVLGRRVGVLGRVFGASLGVLGRLGKLSGGVLRAFGALFRSDLHMNSLRKPILEPIIPE